MKNQIKGVIFDLDDTLYDCNYTNNAASIDAVCTYAAQHLLHLPIHVVRNAFDQARESIKEGMLGDTASQHNRMLYFQRTLELLGLPPLSCALEMYNCFWNDFLSRIIVFDGAFDVLNYLQAKGIRIGICTDMTVHIQHRKMRTLGIASYIDMLMTSEEVGAEKPNPVIYRGACEKMGLLPEECIFVGDSLKKDVLGPISNGMQGIWFRAQEYCDRDKDAGELQNAQTKWNAGELQNAQTKWNAGETKNAQMDWNAGEQALAQSIEFPDIIRVENHKELLTYLKKKIGETV
ncbi:MAG: HAD family hydrolase [Lachnospiraceae bacterium]